MPVFTRTRPNLSNTRSTPKNDGLPFVNGKKVAVNHGRSISSQRGSSKVEDNFEKFTQQNNSFDCSNRVWFFAFGVVVAVCLHLSPTYSLIPTKKGNSNNNDNTTTTTTATTNGSIPTTVVMNKEAVNNNVQAVPDMIDAAVTIPSPSAPETASVPADDTVPVPVPSVLLPPAPPATTCTAAQRELVLEQLPNTCSSGWPSHCSFRVATGGCQNPILARTFFANTNDFRPVASSSSSVPIPFTAVIVGWGNNNTPLDLLRIGSGLDPKYDKDWDTHLSSTTGINSKNTCRTPITTTTTKEGDPPTRLPPQVVVLDWENPASSVLHELKKNHEKELIVEDFHMNGGEYVGKKDSLTTLIQSKLVVTKTESKVDTIPLVLHYLDLVGRSGGYDYTILMELLPELLQNVRFLHFEYNNKQKWSLPSNTLTDLIAHLKTNGLICYWSGDEQTQYGLWRITDCFLDHYNRKNWARIQCVSGVHADVKELATRMETQFLTTLQRNDINNSLEDA